MWLPAGPRGGDEPLLRVLVHLLSSSLSVRAPRWSSHAVLHVHPHPHPDPSSARDCRHRQGSGQQRPDGVAEAEPQLQHGPAHVCSRASSLSHPVVLSRLSSEFHVFSLCFQSGAGLLQGFVERPKQRRHRCKDPTKLDINTLTGEERVPVIHRGTGRRVKTHTVSLNVS